MKLPKLDIKKGRYLGMNRGNDVYGCDYYSVKEVEKYKEAAEKLAKEYKKLKTKLVTEHEKDS